MYHIMLHEITSYLTQAHTQAFVFVFANLKIDVHDLIDLIFLEFEFPLLQYAQGLLLEIILYMLLLETLQLLELIQDV